MTIREICEIAKNEMTLNTNFPNPSVIGVERSDDGWVVSVELLERKCIPDSQDLLAIYEVVMSKEGEMLGYERKRIRRRSDLEMTAE